MKEFKTKISDLEDDIKDRFTSKKQVQRTETEPVMIKDGKKSSKEELLQKIKENSVCGSCLQEYQDEPREVKISSKYEGESVKGYQCPACNTAKKPLRIVIAEVEGNEQGIIEVPMKNLEGRKLKD